MRPSRPDVPPRWRTALASLDPEPSCSRPAGEHAIRFATGLLIALSVGLFMAVVALALCPGSAAVHIITGAI